jgi:hypothetical protein
MVLMAEKHEVLNTIIRGVFVDVVDVLPAVRKASDVCRHDAPVISDLGAVPTADVPPSGRVVFPDPALELGVPFP